MDDNVVKRPEPEQDRPGDLGPLDEIIYRLSHDLRASARALSELPAWVEEDLEAEGVSIPVDVSTSLRMMRTHAARLNLMMDGLLDHSRVGRSAPQILNPAEIFADMIEELSGSGGLRLRGRFASSRLAMAEVDLRRVFHILVRNAVDHHPTIPRLAFHASHQGKDWTLRVRDDGPGIPEEHWERIFSPMVRLQSRDDKEGAGMGLAILDKIAAHYGGSVCVEPVASHRQGTCICVRLPIAEQASLAA